MEITDLFSSRIQKSFDEDNQEILSLFKAKQNESFRLINYYQGMPISYPATIFSVDRSSVDFVVRVEQAFAIEKCRSVFIRSPIFLHAVFARAQYVNIKKMSACFNMFSYVVIAAEERNCIRVVPDPYPAVVIDSPLGVVEGEVNDVSLTGLNVLIHHSCPLEPGSHMKIGFTLKNLDHPAFKVSLPARLVAVTGQSLPRNYKFAIDPDKSLEGELSRYILQRQIEIIKEIKAAVY